tara:strand:+ start:4620 stop:4922 length:303 start_codon:yes stop_codon:yes gene_type:complete
MTFYLKYRGRRGSTAHLHHFKNKLIIVIVKALTAVKENIMFEIFKKKEVKDLTKRNRKKITIDGIERSLWDIKEVYDLPTEEVEKVVIEKRDLETLRSKK